MRISVITILAAMVIAACSGDDSRGIPEPITLPPSPVTPAPTFTEVYTVFTQRCAGCHMKPGGEGITAGKLDLSTQGLAYVNLVGVPAAGLACAVQGSRVVAGQAVASLLYQKVRPDGLVPCGDKMPLGAAPLSKEQEELIEGWINAGAEND